MQLCAPPFGHTQGALGLLGRVDRGLQLGEIATALRGHQTDVSLFEIGQTGFGFAQPLLILFDLTFEKLLGVFAAFALTAQGLFDKAVEDGLDDLEGPRTRAGLINKTVNRPAAVAFAPGAAHRQTDRFAKSGEYGCTLLLAYDIGAEHAGLFGDAL